MTSPAVAAKKQTPTPKAIIHQRFGDKACYEIEEVQESSQNGCPGLSILQKGPSLYRCRLLLPDISVVSDTFKRKKEAEQSAAAKAIEKLGIKVKESDPTAEEAWDDLVSRLSYILLSSEFLPSLHPLSGHFRAALKREGHLNGFVPVSVITTYDSKIGNLCRYINPEVESNPLLATSLVLSACSKLDGSLSSEELPSLRRVPSGSLELVESLGNSESSVPECLQIKAVCIPSSEEKVVDSISLNILADNYYLDVIAKQLGLVEASQVLISRTIGKASSETRLFCCAPKQNSLEQSPKLHANQSSQFEDSLNVRASYLAGVEVRGDAILASIGYKWKSADLFYEDLSSPAYYRMLVSKIPSGIHKLSRDAIFTADLPLTFTTKSSWRGCLPRDILCIFCRQHHLSEPEISTPESSSQSISDAPGSRKKLKVTALGDQEINGSSLASAGAIRCEIKIFSKCRELILQCSPNNVYKKQTDAIQKTALKVLSWLNMFLRNFDMDKLTAFAKELDIQFHSQQLLKAFALCPSVHRGWQSIINQGEISQNHSCSNQPYSLMEDKQSFISLGGQDCGVSPSNGSLACICYTVSLVVEGGNLKENLECSEEFEFEIGTGAVISRLESVVTQISVGQSACFNVNLPSHEFVLAAAGDSATILPLLSSARRCHLEYTVTLLRVTEPLEDRMEQALFSPPLSKQRVEYALQHIKESSATSLVDFGCGSGSLLDSLLEYRTSLEKIVGVDISQKGLTRAAKILHPKLSVDSAEAPSYGIKSAVLYEGSITTFDSRLYGFDIGTCLEVIEHMEEDEASLFGNIVLTTFCPRVLIISTPNYEYNPILQKSTPQCQEEDADEKNQQQPCKFRNHDHKFEWTRAQFNNWASELATRHNYNVEFSGVGGNGDVEPGFASQIAVFRRKDDSHKEVDLAHRYSILWEWSRGNAV